MRLNEEIQSDGFMKHVRIKWTKNLNQNLNTVRRFCFLFLYLWFSEINFMDAYMYTLLKKVFRQQVFIQISLLKYKVSRCNCIFLMLE